MVPVEGALWFSRAQLGQPLVTPLMNPSQNDLRRARVKIPGKLLISLYHCITALFNLYEYFLSGFLSEPLDSYYAADEWFKYQAD